MSQPKHPLYWIYSGLILLLIPVIIGLTSLYENGAKETEAGLCESRTSQDCGYNAWCDDDTNGAEPIRCCEVTRHRDCSFSTGDCSCVA